MKLYRIRRKDDGAFLCDCCTNNPAKPRFNKSGVFWKRIDTIKKHLNDLCTDFVWVHPDGSMRGHKLGMKVPTWDCKSQIVGFNPAFLQFYEVVVHDVTVESEEVIQAKDLVKK